MCVCARAYVCVGGGYLSLYIPNGYRSLGAQKRVSDPLELVSDGL